MAQWCPRCEKLFGEAAVCPECGGALREAPRLEWGRRLPGDILEKWPRDGKGELVAPVFLTHRSGLDMDDAMLVSMLEAYGVPCLRRYPNDGDFGRIILGMGGSGVDVYVPETLAEDALNLISEVDDDGL